MAKTYQLLPVAPLDALSRNFKALKVFPYDSRFRVQLALSFATVTRTYWKQVRFDDGAEDLIYRTALSAGPNNPVVLLSRVVFLLNYDRVDEAQPILDRLNLLHPYQMKRLRIVKWHSD